MNLSVGRPRLLIPATPPGPHAQSDLSDYIGELQDLFPNYEVVIVVGMAGPAVIVPYDGTAIEVIHPSLVPKPSS